MRDNFQSKENNLTPSNVLYTGQDGIGAPKLPNHIPVIFHELEETHADDVVVL